MSGSIDGLGSPIRETSSVSGEFETAEISGSPTIVGKPDTISQADIVLNFAKKRTYDTSMQQPELPPADPEGVMGPQPYGLAEQRLIRKKLEKEVLALIQKKDLPQDVQEKLQEAILSGKSLDDPQLAKIAEEISQSVTKTVREGAHLPTSWTITSTAAEDWTPVPILPYDSDKQKEINAFYDKAFDQALKSYAGQTEPPLTQEQIEQIVTAFGGGKVPSTIALHFDAVSKLAAAEVQKTFGLPSTWFKGTTLEDNWQPINLGIVTPQAVNQARAELLLNNIEGIAEDFVQALKKTMEKIPKDDPRQNIGAEYIAIISKAIRELKAMLSQLQIKDSEQSRELQKTRLDLAEDQKVSADQRYEKQVEQMEQQKKAEKKALIFKILGPIIAALATIVGVLGAIFTGGASLALVVAGIAVGVAMTAYSIVDSLTGCTGKIVEAVNKWLETAFPDNPAMQKFIKALIVAVVVVILIVATVFTGGGAAAQAAGQVAKAVVLETVKQMSVQVIVMTIMASNAIPELIGAILKSAGVDEKTSRIFEIITMVIVMIATMIGAAKGVSYSSGAAGASVGVVQSVKNAATNIVQTAKELMMRIKEGATAAIQELIKVISDLIKRFMALASDIPAMLKETFNKVKDAAASLLKVIKEGKSVETIGEALNKFSVAMEKFSTAAKNMLSDAIDRALEILIAAGRRTKEAALELKEGAKSIGEIPAKFKEIVEMRLFLNKLKAMDQTPKVTQQIEQIEGQLARAGTSLSTKTSQSLHITTGLIESADGIIQGVYGVRLAKLLEDLGEIEESQALIQALIQELNQILQNFTKGIEDTSKDLVALNDFLNAFFARQSESSTQMARALQA